MENNKKIERMGNLVKRFIWVLIGWAILFGFIVLEHGYRFLRFMPVILAIAFIWMAYATYKVIACKK